MKLNIYRIIGIDLENIIEYFKENTEKKRNVSNRHNSNIIKIYDENNITIEISIHTFNDINPKSNVEWSKYFESINWLDKNHKEKFSIKKHKDTIHSVMFLRTTEKVEDGSNEINHFAIPFGQAYHAINDLWIDSSFPFDFINKFSDKSFHISETVYPFSKSNKFITNHKDIKALPIPIGGFLKSASLVINDLPQNITSNISKGNKVFATNSLTLNVNSAINYEEGKIYYKIIWIILEIINVLKNENITNYQVLNSLDADESNEMFELLYRNCDQIEFVESSSNIWISNGKIGIIWEIENQEIFYSDKYNNQIESFDLHSGLFNDIKVYAEENSIEIKDILDNLRYYTHEAKSDKFNIWNYLDVSYTNEENEVMYFLSSGKWFKIKSTVFEQIKKDSKIINEICRFEKIENILEKFSNTKSKIVNGEIELRQRSFSYFESMYNLMQESEEEYYFSIDRISTKKSNTEVGDLIYKEGDNVILSAVKVGIDNHSISVNINQSLASLDHIITNERDLNILIEENSEYKVEDIKVIELRFLITESEFRSLEIDNMPDITKLKDRTISKLMLFEWVRRVRTEGLIPKVKFVIFCEEYNKSFKDSVKESKILK